MILFHRMGVFENICECTIAMYKLSNSQSKFSVDAGSADGADACTSVAVIISHWYERTANIVKILCPLKFPVLRYVNLFRKFEQLFGVVFYYPMDPFPMPQFSVEWLIRCLLFVQVDFSMLFSTLSCRKIIQLFSSMLMERRIILCAHSLR